MTSGALRAAAAAKGPGNSNVMWVISYPSGSGRIQACAGSELKTQVPVNGGYGAYDVGFIESVPV